MRRLALAVAVPALLAGCATTRPGFTCEARGGRPWHAVYSSHFVVATDLDVDDARELSVELDRIRAGVAVSLFPNRHEPPVRATVVAFRSTADFESFAAPGVAAYYASAASDPKIVMPGKLSIDQRRVLAHELAHHVESYVLLRQPRWLSEGLATWAETIGSTAGGGRMQVGGFPPGRRPQLRPQRIAAVRLLAWDGALPPEGLAPYYDAAWLLVHFLLAEHPEELRDLETRLASAEDPDAAFRAAFPQWDPARPGALDLLDADLDGWARRGRFEGRPVHVTVAAAPAAVMPLPPAEVHAIRLLLWPGGASREGDDARRRAELAEALSEDPGHPVLLRELARTEGRDPLPLARRAVEAHPEDPRSWTFLADALPAASVPEREEALRRAVDLAPENPLALSALATLLVAAGRSGEALPLARRAVVLSPFSWPVLDAYAEVSADLGNCQQALLAARRALDVYPERGSAEGRASLVARLAAFEARCAGAR
jgi:tetratricopeptide (TPR) repeat protein